MFVSNHKSTTSRLHRKVKFDMQAYFNPTKRNIKKKLGISVLDRVKKRNKQSCALVFSLGQTLTYSIKLHDEV